MQQIDIRGASGGPRLLVIAGVHGDEFEPMQAVRGLARALRDTTLRGMVTFIPVVNESAFLRGTRTGDDGLDLARVCPGRPDGSETERIAHELSERIRDADFLIDLHTGGTRFDVLPLVGYTCHPVPEVLDQQRRMARAFNLPVVWGTDPALEGRSLSVARDARVPAIYAEYRGAASCDPAGVEAYVNGSLNVMGLLGMVERPAPAPAVEHVVEDPRPGSGHIQALCPAPASGFFAPAVALGDMVRRGQTLGTITDALGTGVQAVTSDRGGLVIVLRSFPSVRAGDALATVIEVDRRGGGEDG